MSEIRSGLSEIKLQERETLGLLLLAQAFWSRHSGHDSCHEDYSFLGLTGLSYRASTAAIEQFLALLMG